MREEAELRGKSVGVQRRLDLEDLDPGIFNKAPHAPVRAEQFGVVTIHERSAVLHRVDIVVMADAVVARETGRN
jgi:hypothetical protein